MKKYIIVLLLLPLPAFAYLDPATGGMLFSALLGIITSLYFLIKLFFFKLTNLPADLRGRKINFKRKYGIVFFSEGPQYWNIFKPIIEELDARGVPSVYMSGKEDDPGLTAGLQNVSSRFIGEGNKGYFLLNTLEADMVIMTTPGLDVFQIKRSKGVRHYCHIVHGMEDTSTYAPYGIDYFDSILVNGEHQLEVVRELEEVKNLPQKHVEIIGSTYLDIMSRRVNPENSIDGKTVLIAPSWGEKGFLTKFGEKLLDVLIISDFNIIVRPHPQSLKAEKSFIESLVSRYSSNGNLRWDFNPDGFESMQKSAIMISDFSGIIYDYIFLFSRPVIVANFNIDPRKYDMGFLKERESTLMKLFKNKEIGLVLNENDIFDIKNIIQKSLYDNSYKDRIDSLKKTIYCYPGESGKRGADFIIQTVNTINSLKIN